MRFSTPDCRLSIMESRWGLIPDMGAAVTLRELVRIDIAKELTMTGRIISGTEAERVGLVTRCVEDPMKEAMKVALEIIERWVDICRFNLFFMIDASYSIILSTAYICSNQFHMYINQITRFGCINEATIPINVGCRRRDMPENRNGVAITINCNLESNRCRW